MSFGDHLDDLRRRLVLSVLGLIPIIAVALVFGKQLLILLILPVQEALAARGLDPTLQATSPLETFGAWLRIVLLSTVIVGSPWLLYQLWKFVAPGLYSSERRFVYVLLPLSSVLTMLGVVFLYYVIFPIVLAFFIGFGTELAAREITTADVPVGVVFAHVPVLEADPLSPSVGEEWINLALMQRRTCVAIVEGEPVVMGVQLLASEGIKQQYKISEYIKLFLSLAFAFALGFQMPVVVLLLGWSGIVGIGTLTKYRKHVMLGCAIGAAFLTPADPVSMVLLALPLYMLFEFGVVLLRVLPAKRVAAGFRSEPRDAGDE